MASEGKRTPLRVWAWRNLVMRILARHKEQPHQARADGSACRCDLCLVCEALIHEQSKLEDNQMVVRDTVRDAIQCGLERDGIQAPQGWPTERANNIVVLIKDALAQLDEEPPAT